METLISLATVALIVMLVGTAISVAVVFWLILTIFKSVFGR